MEKQILIMELIEDLLALSDEKYREAVNRIRTIVSTNKEERPWCAANTTRRKYEMCAGAQKGEYMETVTKYKKCVSCGMKYYIDKLGTKCICGGELQIVQNMHFEKATGSSRRK